MEVESSDGIVPETVIDSANRTSADLHRLISSLPEFLSLADPDIAQMHPRQRAESMLVLAKAASSLISLRLGCAGVNPDDHSIKSELERINLYEAKLERFMDLNKETDEDSAFIVEHLCLQEKALEGSRKRKRDAEEVLVISSPRQNPSAAMVGDLEVSQERESDEVDALIWRPHRSSVGASSAAPLDSPSSLGALVSVQVPPLPEVVVDAKEVDVANKEAATDPTEEEAVSLETAFVKGKGLLGDIPMQLRLTEELLRFKRELPPFKSLEELYSYARYLSLMGAMVPGMLMEAWDQERSRIPALKKEVKHLAKRKHELKKECRGMLASIQDLKSRVAAQEEELSGVQSEVEVLNKQLATERGHWVVEREAFQAQWAAEKEALQAQWAAERESLQGQLREASQALSQMASEKVAEVERAKLDAVEAFKKSDAFFHALVERSGKALENALRSVRNDLKRLYPDIDPAQVPSFAPLLRLEAARAASSLSVTKNQGTPPV